MADMVVRVAAVGALLDGPLHTSKLCIGLLHALITRA